jgi:UDP-glucose 4-epimerase
VKAEPRRRYVVLGAEGFIGSEVVRAALASNAEVVALCVSSPWRLADIDDTRMRRVPAEDWYEPGFIDQLRIHLKGADGFIHLAYRPPSAGLDPAARAEHERVNSHATATMAAAIEDIPIVFASSADVYGAWHDAPVDEDTAPDPLTPYAAAKLEAEGSLRERATVLRVSTVYGPGELVPRAIPSFIKACLAGETAVIHSGGRDIKDYVPLEAVGRAFVATAEAPPPDGQRIFNVSSGVGRSTAEVLDAVIRVVGVTPTTQDVLSPRAPARLVASPERARAALGFDPDNDFEATLRAEVAWLDKNRAKWQ